MGKFVAEKTIKLLIASDRPVKGAKVLILGWTFKENVPDVRNTRVIDIYRELETYGVIPIAFDPHADTEEVRNEYGIDLLKEVGSGPYDAIVLAVRHAELMRDFTIGRLQLLGAARPPVLIDLKSFFDKHDLASFPGATWSL
jgi:UDP-N-acetyl-D-galactosamine dehydrogenase